MSKYTVAVIGCGSIAQHLHLAGYAKRTDIGRLVVADPVAERIAEVTEKFNIAKAYSDYRDLFANEKPDFVSVCTPNKFHAEHAIAALESGAHLLLEKPMTMTLEEAALVKQAAEKSGKQVMIGFSHRMNNSNKAVKEILERGEIGEPFMIRVRFAHGGPFPGWAKSDWFYKPELAGGGALFDMGIHAIDLCNWLIGKVTTVTAEMSALRKPIAVDDNAIMALKFGDRAMGYIEVGWTSGPGFLGLEIYGDNGTIINDYNAPLRVCTGKSTPDLASEVVMEWNEVPVPKTADSWAVEMDYFMDTIIKGDKIPIDITAGIDALAVALAAMQSAKNGQRIKIGS